MEYLFEKVAYLKGLTDGLEITDTTKEGKLLLKVVEVLEDFAEAIVDLDEDVEEMVEFIDVVDEDLADLEEFIYDEDEEFDFDEFECENCGTVIFVDEDDFDEHGNVEVVCPECKEEYVITDDEEDEDCCCDCDCEESEEK